MMKTFNKYNFHKYTFCIFNEVSASEIAELKTNFVSKSGSSYLFTDEGVYRKSNHWGRAANCKWRLQSIGLDSDSRTKIGFAKWGYFHPINELEKLYYIEVNFADKKVQYNHRNLTDDSSIYLRTAAATTKRVKEIRELFDDDKKLTYWNYVGELDQLLKEVIELLVISDLSILQIKQKILD